jgi:hypothetical protein
MGVHFLRLHTTWQEQSQQEEHCHQEMKFGPFCDIHGDPPHY